MTGRPVHVIQLGELRHVDFAPPGDHFTATGVKHAARRALQGRRDVARYRAERGVEIVKIGQRVQQAAGIGMARGAQNLAHRALFHQSAQIHHRHVVGGLRNDPQDHG